MTWDIFVDSNTIVSFEPEWDFKRRDRKNESSHRSLSGKLFIYKTGDYKRWKFKAEFVSSEDASYVNSWWNTNTQLLFRNSSDSQVYSVYIRNRETPLGQHRNPYDDQFRGILEIETY